MVAKKNPPFLSSLIQFGDFSVSQHPSYRARAATAARPIHPATIFPAPEVADEEVLAALEEAAVPVDLELDSEEVPVAVLEEDFAVVLAVEEAVLWGRKS